MRRCMVFLIAIGALALNPSQAGGDPPSRVLERRGQVVWSGARENARVAPATADGQRGIGVSAGSAATARRRAAQTASLRKLGDNRYGARSTSAIRLRPDPVIVRGRHPELASDHESGGRVTLAVAAAAVRLV